MWPTGKKREAGTGKSGIGTTNTTIANMMLCCAVILEMLGKGFMRLEPLSLWLWAVSGLRFCLPEPWLVGERVPVTVPDRSAVMLNGVRRARRGGASLFCQGTSRGSPQVARPSPPLKPV